MAATMGLTEPSTALMASCRPGDSGGLPNSVISAPAMKVRPSQARIPMLISASCASFATPSMIAARTPTLIALTGGLLIQMMPTLSRFSNLPCMIYSDGSRKFTKACMTRAKHPDRFLAPDPPSAVDQVHFPRGLRCHRPQIINSFRHLLRPHQATERRCRLVVAPHGLKALRPQAVSEPGRVNHSGRNHIHSDPWTEHSCQYQAQCIEGALGRDICNA